MNPVDRKQPPVQDRPELPPISTVTKSSSSPRLPLLVTPTAGAQRKIAIAVDLSDESAYAIRWAVDNYLRPGDAVVLLHVCHTTVFYGADWGFVNQHNSPAAADGRDNIGSEEKDGDLNPSNAKNIAEPLEEAKIPYKIHVVKDHDMKERLCLEVERLGLCAMIMGSRGFGFAAKRKSGKGRRLGSVSDYCVNHCVCPVVVVRFPESKNEAEDGTGIGESTELHPVPEEETEDHDDGSDEQTDN